MSKSSLQEKKMSKSLWSIIKTYKLLFSCLNDASNCYLERKHVWNNLQSYNLSVLYENYFFIYEIAYSLTLLFFSGN